MAFFEILMHLVSALCVHSFHAQVFDAFSVAWCPALDHPKALGPFKVHPLSCCKVLMRLGLPKSHWVKHFRCISIQCIALGSI